MHYVRTQFQFCFTANAGTATTPGHSNPVPLGCSVRVKYQVVGHHEEYANEVEPDHHGEGSRGILQVGLVYEEQGYHDYILSKRQQMINCNPVTCLPFLCIEVDKDVYKRSHKCKRDLQVPSPLWRFTAEVIAEGSSLVKQSKGDCYQVNSNYDKHICTVCVGKEREGYDPRCDHAGVPQSLSNVGQKSDTAFLS